MPTELPTSSDQPPREPPRSKITTATRQRLQAVFEHAQKCVAKGDYDYANDLFTQCVVEDPGNLIYLQHFLSNLAKKYDGNKKGARFAALKIKSARSTLTKAIENQQWSEAFQAATTALKLNPWDTATLVLMAKACGRLAHHECQLYCMRWALDVDPKDPVINRETALALERLGQFDQAIACWRRVEQARPGDQEAAKQISKLSVDKTIQQGGYNQEMLAGGAATAEEQSTPSVRNHSRQPDQPCGAGADKQDDDLAEERRLLAAIEANPVGTENYVALADLYTRHDRLPNAERVLTKALSASGGDLKLRELLEDAQLRRVRQQVEIARNRAHREQTEESHSLAQRMAAQANQAELEIFAARTHREPSNSNLQYEFGLRLKQAGKYREAIQAFQASRNDSRRQAEVEIHLGECFQHIRQFKLAATSYEAAVAACSTTEQDTRKLALYRAGVLSMESGDTERAEKHFTDLAGLDFGYRDVADRLDKLAAMRDNA